MYKSSKNQETRQKRLPEKLQVYAQKNRQISKNCVFEPFFEKQNKDLRANYR